MIRVNSAELSCPIPYRTGKVPVVFIHGMLGSPDNWSGMIEQLSADSTVRSHFQLLVFRYDSLRSISEAGRDLLDALREARRQFDPGGRDAAFDRVILVGHSMGGLVAKAAIRARGSEPGATNDGPGEKGSGQAAPGLDRLIFIATPHRGSPVDRGALRSAGSWIARAINASSSAQGESATSVDELAWDCPLLADLERARVDDGVPFHSIIAALPDRSAEGATDGLVPVASAMLDGARSEVVVRTHHMCVRHPEVVREVRRILVEQADLSPPRSGGPAEGLRGAGSANKTLDLVKLHQAERSLKHASVSSPGAAPDQAASAGRTDALNRLSAAPSTSSCVCDVPSEQAGNDGGSRLATPVRPTGMSRAGPIETDIRGDWREGRRAYSPVRAAVSQARA